MASAPVEWPGVGRAKLMIWFDETGQLVNDREPSETGGFVWVDVLRNEESAIHRLIDLWHCSSSIEEFLKKGIGRPFFGVEGDVLMVSLFESGSSDLQEISLVVSRRYVITAHHGTSASIMAVQSNLPKRLAMSPEQILFGVMDQVADGFLETVDGYDDRFDALEDDILFGHDRSREVFALRRELHGIRRVLADQRRIAAKVSRGFPFHDESETTVPFIDIYEAFYHVIDNLDSLRDNLTGLVDLQLNQRSMRLNEVMKFLTIFSTLFLPLSFITGFLGMNLRPMPELSWPHSQIFTIILMLSVAASMIAYFRYKRWM